MKKILNEEKFLAAYGKAIEERDFAILEKETAIANAIKEAEEICATHNYSEAIKETLVDGVKKEQEEKFNLEKLFANVAFFEQFIDEVEEEIIEEQVIAEEEQVVEQAICQECGLPQDECTCHNNEEQIIDAPQNF